MADDAGLPDLMCEVHLRQGLLCFFREDYAASDRIFRMILGKSEHTEGDYFRAVGLWGVGKNLMIREHHEAALPWLNSSLALFRAAGSRLWLAAVWGELAVCHLGLGDDVTALEMFENALGIESEAGTVKNYQVHLANIGNVYLHKGDHLRAIEYYRRALELARQIKDPVSIQKWSYNIRLAYARLCQTVDRQEPKTKA